MPRAMTEAAIKPTMHCIGSIIDVSDVKKTNSGWDSFMVSIEGGANSLSIKKNIMFELDFFRGKNYAALESPKDWKDETITEEEYQTKVDAFHYKSSFDPKKGSISKALGKKNAQFDATIDELVRNDELTPEAVVAVVRQLLVGTTVLYKLKQQKEKQDDGTKLRTEYYECDSFEEYSDKTLRDVEKGIRFSRKNGNTVLVAWEEVAA